MKENFVVPWRNRGAGLGLGRYPSQNRGSRWKKKVGWRPRKKGGSCLSRRSSHLPPRRPGAISSSSRSGRNSEPGKPETFQIYLGWRKFNLKWRLRYNGSLRYSVTQPPARPTHLNFATLVRRLFLSRPCRLHGPCRYLWGNRMPWLARELLKERLLHLRRCSIDGLSLKKKKKWILLSRCVGVVIFSI